MQAPTEKKNEPTWLEFSIAYIFWALLILIVYSVALKPNGYSIKAGIGWLKGTSAKKEEPQKKKGTEKPAKKAEAPVDPMAPVMGADMAPKPVMKPSRATSPMVRKKKLSEDDD